MDAMLLQLLNVSISVSWLVGAVLLLRFCFPKAPKYIRCLLWGLVGVRLLLPFSIKSDFSVLPTSQTIPDEIVYAQIPSVNTGIFSVDMAINPVIGQTLAPQVGDSVNPVQVWLAIGGVIWLVGMMVMLLYAIGSYWSVRRRVREAALLFDNVYHGDRIQSPFILGLFRPRIYLPSDMSEQDRVYVLAHEQAHLARRDHLWKPLGFALLSVYWFNPLLWVAYIMLCRDIEFACDEKVIASYGEYGEEQKKWYADALINCSAPRRHLTACPLAFGENGVKGRIKSVLHYKKPAFWVVVAALLTCIAVAVCFLTDPKDEWESENYGIVGTVSSAECENVLFHYREGSINHADPYITVQLKNDTDDTLCYGEKFTLLRDGEPCPTLQDPRWNAILKMLPPDAETSQTYALGDYDLSQNGNYRLETEVYFKSDPDTTYIAYVEFGIDRIYSFVGWQYKGDGIVYGNDREADARYTDDSIPNVYITEDSVRLQIAQSGTWHEIGALTQDKLDRNNFDYMLTEDWWDAGYSAKILHENNKHTVSYVDSGANERYYLLEQKNGEIYLAMGRLSEIDWIFRLIPVSQTNVISTTTSEPNTPTGSCVVTKAPITLNGISLSVLRCEEKEGGLFMTVKLKNNTDKTITFGPEFTLLHNQRKIYPNEGHAWDTILYSVPSGETFEQTLNISACVAKGEYQLQKSIWFEPRTETPVAFPVTLNFTLPETRQTTFRVETPTTTTATGPTSTTKPNGESYFNATVLQVFDGTARVRVDEAFVTPLSGEAVINTNTISQNNVEDLQAGMTIRVVYNGEVQETYPVQIRTVFAIYRLNETAQTPITATPSSTISTSKVTVSVEATAEFVSLAEGIWYNADGKSDGVFDFMIFENGEVKTGIYPGSYDRPCRVTRAMRSGDIYTVEFFFKEIERYGEWYEETTATQTIRFEDSVLVVVDVGAIGPVLPAGAKWLRGEGSFEDISQKLGGLPLG